MIKNAENFGPEVSGLNDKGVVIIMDDYRTCIEASNAVKDFEMKINTKFKLKNYSKGCVYFFKT